MTSDETRALWEKFKAADQAHDAEAISQLYAKDVGGPGFPFRGREALRKFDSAFYAAFPDYQREYLKEVIEGDTAAIVWRYTATHTGRWMGVEQTGLKLDVRGCSVLTFRNGHIAEVEMFGPGVMGELVREANLQLVRRFYAAENARDLDTCAACLAPDVEVWGNGSLMRSGRETHVEHMRATIAAFPDWRGELLSLLADGDTVVARWRGSGTHAGPYGAIPATGKRIELFGTISFEIRGGLIQFYRFDVDTSPLLALADG